MQEEACTRSTNCRRCRLEQQAILEERYVMALHDSRTALDDYHDTPVMSREAQGAAALMLAVPLLAGLTATLLRRRRQE